MCSHNFQNQPKERQVEPYKEIVRENEDFEKYYKHQKICPPEEWGSFLEVLRKDLPVTFRVTSFRGEAERLSEIIKDKLLVDYLQAAEELTSTGEIEAQLAKPTTLSWYPDGLAWMLELTRKNVRRSEKLFKLHNFLISETNSGNISRQEAVSMIPPIVLDVQSHHKVLDMCAAPGSKTAQIIEALHSNVPGKLPTGFVIANDIDNNRCYMLVHQAKRLNSPCCLITNTDSAVLPKLF
jgi:tRNA (cytosine34-C5)-methyltransferase